MTNKEQFSMGNAVEGESYVGKSTALEKIEAIKEIREQGIIIIPEYAAIGEFVDFPRETTSDIKKAVARIIDIEKRRTDILTNKLAKDKNSVVIFDRGPISCIAFEHAAQKAGFKGAALWMAEAFEHAISDNKIIVPSGMIHLTASSGVVEERKKSDLRKGKGEIIDFLQDENVISTLNKAFKSFGSYLPKQLFMTLETDRKGPEEVSAAILQFVTNQDDQVENSVPDFLTYAKSLIK